MPTADSEIFQVVSDVLNVPLAQVTPATSPATVEGWDSVQHLNLVLALESALGLSLEPEDIEKMQSVAGILAVVRAKGG
ncbi:MAG: acyl carrier protein [Phycisphaerae bacterium]|nr:acyl carrier protein [Tepidisphaeraceae bacterium]